MWRLLKAGPHASVPEEGAAERKALYLVAATFFLLALYIIYEAVGAILSGEGGKGSSTTVVHKVTLDGLLSEAPMHVNVHEPGSGDPPPVACANLNEAR